MAGLAGRLWRSALMRRAALFVVGVAIVASSAYVVFHVLPSGMDARPGDRTDATEHVRYWRPDDGWQTTLRSHESTIREADGRLVLAERLGAAASPRGRSFQLPIDEDLRAEEDPGTRAGFPPTGVFQAPRETVYIAVPWADEGSARVGAYDAFHRTGTEERDGLQLVSYRARHAGQFFVHEGKIWYRASARTALVEPVTGTVVDYTSHETLWTEPMPLLGIAHQVHELTTQRTRVWEATVEPTPATSAALLEQARALRAEHLEDLLLLGLPGLAMGDLLIWAAIARRPHQVFPGGRGLVASRWKG